MPGTWGRFDMDQMFFDCLGWGRGVLEEALGPDGAREAVALAGQEYMEVKSQVAVPQTMGGKANLSTAVVFLPLYRVLKKKMDQEQALDLVARFGEACLTAKLDSLPWPVKKAMRSPLVLRSVFRLMAWQDNRVDDANGWRYQTLPTQNGHILDFDASRCGVHRFLTEQGAPELTRRAVCPLDDLFAENYLAPGSRLVRTTYLSQGGECCDFRFIGPG